MIRDDDVKKTINLLEEKTGTKVPPPQKREQIAGDGPNGDVPRATNPTGSRLIGESQDWPDPEPIRNDLRPVAPLRPETIPEPLRACHATSPTGCSAQLILLRPPRSA